MVESGVAFAKLLKYRNEKVSVTGSFRSITVASSCTAQHAQHDQSHMLCTTSLYHHEQSAQAGNPRT